MSSEAIYSALDGVRAGEESAAWEQFSQTSDTSEFCASWLAILCSQIERVRGALLLLGPDAAGAYSAAAVWPDATRDMQYLSPAAEKTLRERRGFTEQVSNERRKTAERVLQERRSMVLAPETGRQSCHVGYPVEASGVLYGAVVLDIEPLAQHRLQHALRLVHWGSAWLMDRFHQQLMLRERERSARLSLASDAIATAMQHARLGASALALANELATRLGCERVALGFERAGAVKVAAISHTATLDARSDFVRLIEEAMDEVLDLDLALVHPAPDADSVTALAHASLSGARNDACVLSVPLQDDGVPIGVMTFERLRERPFDAQEIELCKTLGLLLGPLLELKQRAQLSLWQRASAGLREASQALLGPQHPGLKLVALTLAVLLAVFSLASGSYRVSARTVIEGSVQRAMVAPFQGYVFESLVRAGDTVTKGQTLARLDERELQLERTRWAAEAEQMQRRYRQAAAAQERAAMAVASAQMEQAQAQLALVQERLARATLSAPFDAIVVSGDLSQLLGSPVEQGKVLFELAPLDGYRVILNVDERDIAELRAGQRGELALAGMPHERLAFTVHQITPMSTPQDGRNFFRVEAQLDNASARLRPGMEGIGKVEIDERKLIWIWSHPLLDWLRLWSWRWFG